MSEVDIIQMHERMARTELIKRIELRDRALLTFLGGVGVIATIAAESLSNKDSFLPLVLALVPYFALAFTSITEHHNMMIGLIGRYLAIELDSHYQKMGRYIPQWDGSVTLIKNEPKKPRWLRRIFASIGLITIPSIAGLAVSALHFFYNLNSLSQSMWQSVIVIGLFLGGIICLIWSVIIIVKTDQYRKRIYDEERAILTDKTIVASS
jgi:hypothetical protein